MSHIASHEHCPECGMQWRHTFNNGLDDVERTGSHIVAVYDRAVDRTVGWACPSCNHRWPRDAVVPKTSDA